MTRKNRYDFEGTRIDDMLKELRAEGELVEMLTFVHHPQSIPKYVVDEHYHRLMEGRL